MKGDAMKPTPKKKTKAAQSSEGAATEPIPGDIFLEWLIDRMKEDQLTERRIPKILKGRFARALSRYGASVKGISQDEIMELRARAASNWSKCIAAWGVLNIGAPVPDLDLRPFPSGYHEAAKELREACDELSHYLNGGAADWCAASVAELVTSRNNSSAASLPRKDIKSARALWDAWQKDISLYPNKQQFTDSIRRKCKVSQNTARKWFNQFRLSAAHGWESAYGQKYPM